MNKLKIASCALLASVAVTGSLTGQAAAPDVVAFRDPRPLAQAALALSREYGQAITYEDPPYVFEADRSDVTDPKYAREHPGKRLVVPAWRTLMADRSTWPAVAAGADLAAPLETLMERHKQTGGAVFRLERTGELLHIVPARARNANGDWKDLTSILEVPITVPSHRTNGINAVLTIVEAVGSNTGIKISVGLLPMNVLAPHQIDLAAQEETARTVLMRVLAAASTPLYWHLYYGPPTGDESGNYVMSVLSVSPRPTPSR